MKNKTSFIVELLIRRSESEKTKLLKRTLTEIFTKKKEPYETVEKMRGGNNVVLP